MLPASRKRCHPERSEGSRISSHPKTTLGAPSWRSQGGIERSRHHENSVIPTEVHAAGENAVEGPAFLFCSTQKLRFTEVAVPTMADWRFPHTRDCSHRGGVAAKFCSLTETTTVTGSYRLPAPFRCSAPHSPPGWPVSQVQKDEYRIRCSEN